jgi:hypothetical protein
MPELRMLVCHGVNHRTHVRFGFITAAPNPCANQHRDARTVPAHIPFLTTVAM